MIKFVKGTYQDLLYIKTYKWRKISIDSMEKLVVNADGDILGNMPVTFSIKPLSINVISS